MMPSTLRTLLSVLLLAGLVSGCGGGLPSKKSRKSTTDSRLGQQEDHPGYGSAPVDEDASAPAESPVQQASLAPEPAHATLPQPTPSRTPYRPMDISQLPTTFHRADRSVMVLVPDGSYLVTQAESVATGFAGGGGSLYPVPMKGFYIDRNEITVEQFKKLYPQYHETVYTEGRACPHCPAMGVTLLEAKAYCLNTGKRLPTEAQWEAAGRGRGNQPYPWGKTFDPQRANLTGSEDGNTGPADVGSYPQGASDFGALDMIGNVWEWVDTGGNTMASAASTPAGATGTAEKVALSVAMKGRVKGGGYRSTPETAILSARHEVPATLRNPTFGFRCVKEQ